MAQIIFVDDDETDLVVLRRMLRPVADKWDMTFVNSGANALRAMEETEFDVIVSDMQMPEMDGIELLEAVRERNPSIVRIILSSVVEQETKLRAVNVAHIWMAKPCDVEFLGNIVERTSSWGEFLHDAPLKRLTNQLQSLPSLPQLYLRLAEELRSPEASFASITNIVCKDIAMTAKILQVANCAFFGFSSNISSLKQAVSLLGLNTIRTLALSLGIFSQFNTESQKSFSIGALMNHSLATGNLAKSIAKMEGQEKASLDEAFTAGMLHDAGKLVLAHNMPENYERALTVASERNIPVWQAEHTVFGATHAQISAYLMALWGMPDSVIEASAYHHTPSDCKKKQFSTLTAVHVADALEHGEHHDEGSPKQGTVNQDYLESLGMKSRFAEWDNAINRCTQKESA